ncbi:MAG: DUF4157 domain-containing protein, partial [Ardenticatenales bacterium]|nr:DUF4157 domain-containing protein [Ardenticatenales bacterium]
MLQRLGSTHGNQHVQRVVAAMQGTATSASSASFSASPPSQTPSPSPVRSTSAAPLLQAKLSVNEPGDEYEREADQIADQVMRAQSVAPPAPPEDNGNKSAPATPYVAPISRLVQASGDVTGEVSPEVERNISSMRGGGQPLPREERTFFEERMGVDLDNVRIHDDSKAIQTSRDINAKAFTVGSNIAFNAGEYQPGTDSGRRLLAHELTHVVQQGAASTLQRKAAAAEGTCPICGKTGKGTCPGCGESFTPIDPIQRQVGSGSSRTTIQRFKIDKPEKFKLPEAAAPLAKKGLELGAVKPTSDLKATSEDPAASEAAVPAAIAEAPIKAPSESIAVEPLSLRPLAAPQPMPLAEKGKVLSEAPVAPAPAVAPPNVREKSAGSEMPAPAPAVLGTATPAPSPVAEPTALTPMSTTVPTEDVTAGSESPTLSRSVESIKTLEKDAIAPAPPALTDKGVELGDAWQSRTTGAGKRAASVDFRSLPLSEGWAAAQGTMAARESAPPTPILPAPATPKPIEVEAASEPLAAIELPPVQSEAPTTTELFKPTEKTVQAPDMSLEVAASAAPVVEASPPPAVAETAAAIQPATEAVPVEPTIETALVAAPMPEEAPVVADPIAEAAAAPPPMPEEAPAPADPIAEAAAAPEKTQLLEKATPHLNAAEMDSETVVAAAQAHMDTLTPSPTTSEKAAVSEAAVMPQALFDATIPQPKVAAVESTGTTPTPVDAGLEEEPTRPLVSSMGAMIKKGGASIAQNLRERVSSGLHIQRSMLPGVIQRDLLDELIPDWVNDLLDSFRGDAAAKEGEIQGEGSRTGGEIDGNSKSKGDEIQTEGETKRTELEGEQITKGAEL